MTISQQRHRADSPAWRALRKSARALRNLHDEQVYAWERFFRPAGAPRPRSQAPSGDSHAAAGSRTPASAGVAGS